MLKNRQSLIIVITGPSGAGKTSLLKYLPSENFYFSVSHTTRPPRKDEIDGRDYYFVSEDKFLEMIKKDEFLEWVEIFGTYYGTAKSEIEKAFSQGKHLVLDIEVIGATRMKSYFGNSAVFIFVLPPSIEEIERRLRKRETEDDKKIRERIQRAREEIRFASWFDYVIINENLEKAKDELFSIIRAELCKPFRNPSLKNILNSLIYE
ncbi:MAG: guanylate kinase [Thermodesulfobacterium geofontis]|uniref:Guanylate kinase n=1 Tax=Thermodesulfobacterium geofontis TaxID=1295609 RepID=A0A2N7QB73_9BACT|nr:MAG: guanylate kinase [Thermodesulfobacterium geofontis]HEM55878.1 guanylate kinase [Thermodesulfobium narugense]